jgi:urea transport system permease protein
MRFRQTFVTVSLQIGIVLLVAALAPIAFAATSGATDPSGVPQQLQDAVRSLKSPDDAVRQKAYDLIADQGDARLKPALQAYHDGKLQDLDGRLIIYGDSVEQNGQKAFPLLDAFTNKQITDPNGLPVFVVRKYIDPTAPGMMRPPPAKRAELVGVSDLISRLSLLDPNPEVRLKSIRDTGERAAKVFPDPQDAAHLLEKLASLKDSLKAIPSSTTQPSATAKQGAIDAIDAAASQKPADLLSPAPDQASARKVVSTLQAIQSSLPEAPVTGDPNAALRKQLDQSLDAARKYRDQLDKQKKELDDVHKYAAALQKQLTKEPNGPFAAALKEANAEMDVVVGDPARRLAAIKELGNTGTGRAENELGKTVADAARLNDPPLLAAAQEAYGKAHGRQTRIQFAQNTFAGLSAGSILVLLALGLSIIFGLMDVINMAHGEFMMIGAFTTYVVSEFFKHSMPSLFDYYPIVAVPAAFIVAGAIGYLCEGLIIRYLYGRPLDTLLATFGLSLMLIQIVRWKFGDTLSVTPPSWMEGGWEVVPDMFLARDRLYIIIYCVICIAVVYFIVNWTKMGLLLRATTQNRQMAAALGVPTRRVDGLTFAFGCGLAGLAGVAVPLYNKINPSIGQEYIVDSFMVVVVGGVGTLAGAIYAGFGLGFLTKYLEPVLASFPAFSSSSSVIAKVLVLAAIVMFLTRRPQGLFPPKGRLADA